MTDLYAAALDLADQMIPVFPCNGSKQPLIKGGFHAATLDPQTADYAGAALVGFPTGSPSGFDVLDIDPRHGGDTWLAANGDRLPHTRVQTTQSGGLHFYFRARKNMRCSVSKVAPGVDIRAEGGYVIAWQVSGLSTQNPDDLADWPEWLADAAQGSRVRHADNPTRSAADLAAPSAQAVVDLLNRMPNPDDTSRDTYIAVMLAAKGCIDALDPDDIGEDISTAAIEWACRWIDSPGEEAERQKWDEDFGTRDAPLAGWSNLLAAATRLGVDTAAERAAAAALEFASDPLPPLPHDPDARLLEMTEDAAAQMFAEQYADRFVFDHTEKRWFEFTAGQGWAPDESRSIDRTVRAFVRKARVHWGEDSSKSAAKIAFAGAVERGCQSDARMAVTSRVWDADPLILGVPGGAVDLRTGAYTTASPTAFVLRRTRVVPAGQGAVPVTWLRFLGEATGGDAGLQVWLQRLAGYALTGDVSEEMLAFFYGSGGNGKGVLLHTLSAIMGDYAYQAPAELFKADSRTNREYQLARLDGVRLLMASETESGARLDESFVKEITGNEGKINARHPYGRPFEFRPQAKLIIVGNHAPKLTGRSPAMERRLRVVPFDRRPAKPDFELKDKIIVEYPAILRWMLDGCAMWRRDRLGTAAAIGAASSAYFDEQDTLSQWISERCEIGPDHYEGSAVLLDHFNRWLRGRGERVIDARAFKEAMGRIPGVAHRRKSDGVRFDGLQMRPEPLPD